jgi:gluconolactonase
MRLVIVSAILFLPAPATSDYLKDVPAEMAIIAPGDPDVVKPATGFTFTEGPVWDPANGYVIFSDIDGDQMWRHTPPGSTVSFRNPSYRANGNTLDLQGSVITCEQTRHCVSRNGIPLVSQYAGKDLNAPNDVVVKSDGTIWFTDPDYSAPVPKPQPGNYVYRCDSDGGNLTAVVTTFTEPNGLCFSPDESKLYIADSGAPHWIRVFTVNGDNSLTEIGTSFVTISNGAPDGIRCDVDGRIFSSCGNGVQVFLPNGTKIGTILVPEGAATTNLCFGGADGKTLFMTAKTSLYSVHLNVLGAGVAGGNPLPPGGGGGCGLLGLEALLALLIVRHRAHGASRPASR